MELLRPQNNAEAGASYTCPSVYTDSPLLKWLETEELAGKIESGNGKLVIVIGRKQDIEKL